MFLISRSECDLEEIRDTDNLQSMFYVPSHSRYNLGQNVDAGNDIHAAISAELDMRLAKRYPSMCNYDLGGYYTSCDYELDSANTTIINPLYLEESVEDIYSQMQSTLSNYVKNTLLIPVYAFIHGGIKLSIAPFGCRFDSGVIGFMAMTSAQLKEHGVKTTKSDYLTSKDKALITAICEEEIRDINAALDGSYITLEYPTDSGSCDIVFDDLESHIFH